MISLISTFCAHLMRHILIILCMDSALKAQSLQFLVLLSLPIFLLTYIRTEHRDFIYLLSIFDFLCSSTSSPLSQTSSSFFGSENLEDELEEGIVRSEEILSQIPQPQTSRESIKFLSRSWSLSASEISKALAQKQRRQQDLFSVAHNSPKVFFQDVATDPLRAENIMNSSGIRSPRRLSKWFHHKQHTNPSTMRMSKKKDKARVEKTHVHTAVSIAALAAGLASVTSEESSSKESSSTMTLALALAIELLATHCIEMVEQAGADRTCIASTVKFSIDFHTPCNLMTLTATTATGKSIVRKLVC